MLLGNCMRNLHYAYLDIDATMIGITSIIGKFIGISCTGIVLPAKSDSDVMFCLQSHQGLRIDRSLVY